MKKSFSLLLLFLFVPLSVAAQDAGESAGSGDGGAKAKLNKCLRIDNANGWATVDDRTIIVWAPRSRPYRVTFEHVCLDFNYATNIAFIPRGPGRWLCGGAHNYVQPLGTGSSTARCRVETVELLSKEAADALLERPD